MSIKESIMDVFGEKSQDNDNLKSLKGSLNSIFLSSIDRLLSTGELKKGDVKDIIKNTPTNVGLDLGKGYGVNLGVNTPSPAGGMRDDFRFTFSKKFEEGGGVDWDFISALEGGSQTEGYIPTSGGDVVGKSGLTIGTGWDVGQMSLDELKGSGLPSGLIEKVSPFAGLRGKEALSALEEFGAPTLEGEEASIIDAFTHDKALSQISRNYEKSSGKSFADLSPAQQTVLASVGFQYGSNLEKATPGLWEQATSGDWEGAHKNLMDFGDIYGTRRGKEAELLASEFEEGGKVPKTYKDSIYFSQGEQLVQNAISDLMSGNYGGDAMSLKNLKSISTHLDKTGDKLVTMDEWIKKEDDPHYEAWATGKTDANKQPEIQAKQELANSLEALVKSETVQKFKETMSSKGGKTESEVLEDFHSMYTRSQSPYSEVGVSQGIYEDMVSGEFREHVAYTMEGEGGEHTPMLDPVTVTPEGVEGEKKKGLIAALQRLVPGGKTGRV